METKFLCMMSLLTLYSGINSSKPYVYDPQDLKLHKEPYKRDRKKNKKGFLSASVLMPSEVANAAIATTFLNKENKATSEIQAAPAANVAQATRAISTQEKTLFSGFWSTRYRPLSYASNWWYVPTYKRAMIELESFDAEKQIWDVENSKQFLSQALVSFKKHNKTTELHKFLVLAQRKSIPLGSLDQIQAWLREEIKTQEEKKSYNDCLSIINLVNKKQSE